jgi:hypothetical protein
MGLKGQRKAYDITQGDFSAMLKERGIALLGTATAFWGAADQYITALEARIIELEQRNKDLETVVKTVHGDMEARPDTLAELGHERGLDMLQWLNNARRFDIQDNKNNGAPGSRHYVYMDLAPLQQLAQRGYATIDADTQTCRVTDAGMDYIKALKHDLRK